MIPVFVYGTLRPSLYPHRKLIGHPAKMDASGWELVNIRGKFPAAIPLSVHHSGNGGRRASHIHGEVIYVDDLSEIDAYEGYLTNNRGLYLRTDVRVLLNGNRDTTIVKIYYMTEEKLKNVAKYGTVRTIASGDWADELGGWR